MGALHDPVVHVRITNPFNPNERVAEPVEHRVGMTIADMFPIGLAAETVVSLNGKIIEPEQFSLYYLTPGDHVVSCPVPTGGGGGSKQILRIVAMIAIAIAAPYAAAAIGPSLGLAAGSIGMAALTAGISIAGSMLVNALLPVKPVSGDSSASDLEKSEATYGIDGAKNVAAEGIPVPVCYGDFRMGGNLLNLYVENIKNTQLLYALFNAGEGPVADITDIEINDQPLSYYTDVEWQTRLGEVDQEVIPWFESIVTPESVGIKLTTSWTSHNMLANAEKLRFDFVFPQGLYKIDKDKGTTLEYTVELEAEYRKVGDTAWIPVLDTSTLTASAETMVPKSVEETDPLDPGEVVTGGTNQTTQTPTYGTSLTVTDKQRSALRVSFATGELETGMYETRVRRKVAQSTDELVMDEVWISDINRILIDKIAMNNTALVAVKIKLTDQLNGLPKVTYKNHGRMIRMWDPTANAGTGGWIVDATANPAWIVLDMMTNKRYGGGIPESRIDLERFKEWAEFCDEEELTFKGVIDAQSNVWDAMQYVLRCGHAQIFNIGTRYSLVIERETPVSMLFTTANILEGTYKETWLPAAERANEVEVSYFDETDNNKQHTVKVFDSIALNAAGRQKTASITLVGVTTQERAWYEGFLQLALNRFVLKTVEFEAPVEAIACTVGDVVLVQHDMPNYAQAGRFEAGSTTSVLKLDREVGVGNALLVLHPALQRASGTISSIVGKQVFLSGFSGVADTRGLRLKGGTTVDVEVTSSTSTSVWVASTTGLTVGQAYTLWATDVIEERTVASTNGKEVTLAAPLTRAPEQFDNWMFGTSTTFKQPFRVREIQGSNNEQSRKIVGIQYDERVYDPGSVPGLGVGSAPPGEGGGAGNPANLPISHAQNLAITEETYVTGPSIRTDVTLTWNKGPNGVYKGADIYMKRNGGGWVAQGSVIGPARRFTFGASKGDQIQLKVHAFDVNDLRAEPAENAPIIGYTVWGEPPSTSTPGVTGIELWWSGKHCKVNWRYNATSQSFEFGNEGDLGADAGALDPQFKDYEVKIFRSTGGNGPTTGVHLRTEYVTTPTYTYLYDLNHTDNAAADPSLGPQRLLRFEVRARDIWNQTSAVGIIDAYNPQSVLPELPEPIATPGGDDCAISYEPPAEADWVGSRVWLSTDEFFVPDETTIWYTGEGSNPYLKGLSATTLYYYYIATYDAFDLENLTLRGPFSFTTTVGGGGGACGGFAEFFADGTFIVPPGVTGGRVTLVGGGAGGANMHNATDGSGGGGSAEYTIDFPVKFVGGTMAVVVGEGGTGAPSGAPGTGTPGGLSSFAGIRVLGGDVGSTGGGKGGGVRGGDGGAPGVGNGLVGTAMTPRTFGGSGGGGGSYGAGAAGDGGGSGGYVRGGLGGGLLGGGGGGATPWGPGGDGGDVDASGADAPAGSHGAGGGGAGKGTGTKSGGDGHNGYVLIEW